MSILKSFIYTILGIGSGIFTPILIMSTSAILTFPVGMFIGLLPMVAVGLVAGYSSKIRSLAVLRGIIYGCFSLPTFIDSLYGFKLPQSEIFFLATTGALLGLILSQIGFSLTFLHEYNFRKKVYGLIIISAVIMLCSLAFNFLFLKVSGMDFPSFIDKYSCQVRGGKYDNYWNLQDSNSKKCIVPGNPTIY